MATYKILSIDGGGIRGLLTTVVLERLETAVPGWIDQANLLAGTSTGGIIALGLAQGLSPETLRQLYYDKGSRIFDDSWLDDLLDLGQIRGADYSNSNLRRELRRIMGETLLQELKKHVLIPTFDLDNEHGDPMKRSWKPKFFHNFAGDDSDGDVQAYKVALYTSAAPTYFPSVDGYIDGGVIANNPSMAALVQTQDERVEIQNRPEITEIVLLSLGTGNQLYRIEGKRHDWGFAQWAKPIINVMMDGGMGVADYQCQQILGERYHRLSPILEAAVGLADWRRRDELVRIGQETDLGETIAWLEQQWMAL
jgi:patatin-like phospholipase/acyl hydrolase